VLLGVSLTRKPASRRWVSRRKAEAEDERLGNMNNFEGTVSDMDVKQIYDWWWKSNGAKKG